MPATKTEDNSDVENNNVVDDDIKQKLLPTDDEDNVKKAKKKEVEAVTPHVRKVRLLSLVILGLAELLGGCTLSILAPFYSAEAEVHGLGATEAGVVFASIFVVQIVLVPVFGQLIGRIGSCRLFISGVLVAGTTTAAFGFLPAIRQGPAFLASSLALRSVTAVGEAAMNTAVLPLARRRGGAGRECSVLSWMETMNGMGTTFGPFIGGVLYDSGGFCLPFLVSGGLLVFCGLAGAVVLDPEEELVVRRRVRLDSEEEEEEEEEDEEGEGGNKGYWTLLCNPSVLLGFLITISTGLAQQWYQPSLEPYVRQQFHLSTLSTSSLFIIDGAVYAVASPVVGVLLDRVLCSRVCMALGTSTIGLGFLLMGLPGAILHPSLAQVCLGAALHGLGMSCCFLSTLTTMSAGEQGHPSQQVSGMLTSLWIVAENMGSFLGAWAGGAAYDRMGWSTSCLMVTCLELLALLLILATSLPCTRRSPAAEGAATPLLGGSRPGYGATGGSPPGGGVEGRARGPSPPPHLDAVI